MSAWLTRVKRWTSQLANQPRQNATNRMIAVVMINSVLFIGGVLCAVGRGCFTAWRGLFNTLERCFYLGHGFRLPQFEFDPAVRFSAILCVVGGDGLFLTVAAHLVAGGKHTAVAQRVDNGLSALLAKLEVHFLAALAVRMPGDDQG